MIKKVKAVNKFKENLISDNNEALLKRRSSYVTDTTSSPKEEEEEDTEGPMVAYKRALKYKLRKRERNLIQS